MGTRPKTCPKCERLARRVAELERLLAEALARIEQLEKELASARKTPPRRRSRLPATSSSPRDPRCRLHGKRKRKRRRGGQPGHEKHHPTCGFRLTKWTTPGSTSCRRRCGHRTGNRWTSFSCVQQVDLVKKLFEVTEHRVRLYRLRGPTGEVIAGAPLPTKRCELAGLVGPRLTALLGFSEGGLPHVVHASIRTFLGDVLGLSRSPPDESPRSSRRPAWGWAPAMRNPWRPPCPGSR